MSKKMLSLRPPSVFPMPREMLGKQRESEKERTDRARNMMLAVDSTCDLKRCEVRIRLPVAACRFRIPGSDSDCQDPIKKTGLY